MNDHDHAFGMPLDVDPAGGSDPVMLRRLIGAAYAGCAPCQATALTAVSEHPPTSARVVEVTCTTLVSALGSIPEAALSTLSTPFRTLATVGDETGVEYMRAAAVVMTTDERRQAVDSALDLLIGILFGPPGR
ncbi:hypothetical protein ACTD5D_32145 [Nocardia takedensis]|uniref:hypothetical protein n=1 Tax=Nocardia takedensis TaxID=259390 RepID=UPI003F76910D